jgi:hypothetical protein
MISTVTTTTVSTVTTVAMAGSLALLVVIMLLILLIQREVIAASEGPRAKLFVRALNIAIAPLLMAFAMSMVVKVLEVLRPG